MFPLCCTASRTLGNRDQYDSQRVAQNCAVLRGKIFGP